MPPGLLILYHHHDLNREGPHGHGLLGAEGAVFQGLNTPTSRTQNITLNSKARSMVDLPYVQPSHIARYILKTHFPSTFGVQRTTQSKWCIFREFQSQAPVDMNENHAPKHGAAFSNPASAVPLISTPDPSQILKIRPCTAVERYNRHVTKYETFVILEVVWLKIYF